MIVVWLLIAAASFAAVIVILHVAFDLALTWGNR